MFLRAVLGAPSRAAAPADRVSNNEQKKCLHVQQSLNSWQTLLGGEGIAW